jgi:hypothetical protein
VDDDQDIMRGIDSNTVDALQLRAPRASTEDALEISQAMESSGKLFPLVQDPSRRAQIKQNIMSVPHLIPTLSSFCEDTKYLEAISKSMRLLVQLKEEGKEKETVEQALRRIYRPPTSKQGRFFRQDGENLFVEIQSDEPTRFKHSVWELALKCMRDFPEMVNISCRKDDDRTKPTITEPNAIAIHQLASLAYRLGFRSSKIEKILSADPEVYEMRVAVARLEPDDEHLDAAYIQSEATELLRVWKEQKNRRANIRMAPIQDPPLTTDRTDQEMSHRCGRPFDKAHRDDKKFLFFRWIADARYPRGRYITSFFVKRSVFTSFFIDDETVPAATALAEVEMRHGLDVAQDQPEGAVPAMVSIETGTNDLPMTQNETEQAVLLYGSGEPAAPPMLENDQPMDDAGPTPHHGVSV